MGAYLNHSNESEIKNNFVAMSFGICQRFVPFLWCLQKGLISRGKISEVYEHRAFGGSHPVVYVVSHRKNQFERSFKRKLQKSVESYTEHVINKWVCWALIHSTSVPPKAAPYEHNSNGTKILILKARSKTSSWSTQSKNQCFPASSLRKS